MFCVCRQPRVGGNHGRFGIRANLRFFFVALLRVALRKHRVSKIFFCAESLRGDFVRFLIAPIR